MYDSRTVHGREAVEVLQAATSATWCSARAIRKTIKFAEAPVKGESVLKYAPDSQAAKAYRQLAREVLNGKKI